MGSMKDRLSDYTFSLKSSYSPTSAAVNSSVEIGLWCLSGVNTPLLLLPTDNEQLTAQTENESRGWRRADVIIILYS